MVHGWRDIRIEYGYSFSIFCETLARIVLFNLVTDIVQTKMKGVDKSQT